MTVPEPDFQAWIGREQVVTDTLAPFPARALAALLDRPRVPEIGDVLPPAWHWLYFLDTPTPGQTGTDGHPRRGGFLPPITLERRMWASGSIAITRPLVLGQPAERVSRIVSVTPKHGDSGPLIFVVVEHRISQAGKPGLVEEQTLVYRAMPDGPQPATPPQPVPGSTWTRSVPVDPVTLFKYSALTFNGHRIHYDRPYAKEVEHYPGLVVHGPLLATLLLDLVARERPDAAVTGFNFRATAPTVDDDALTLHGEPDPDGAALWTHNGRGVSMKARARFASGAPS